MVLLYWGTGWGMTGMVFFIGVEVWDKGGVVLFNWGTGWG